MKFTSSETTNLFNSLNTQQQSLIEHLVTPASIDDLLKILTSPEAMNNRWLEASLHAAVLQDLHNNLSKNQQQEIPNDTPWWKRILFTCLKIAGSLYALCAGFDGITAFLALFTSIPAWAIVLSGFLFSILSIAVFYGFDLVTIASNLNISFNESRQLLDLLQDEIKWIKKIKQHLLAQIQYDASEQPQKIIAALLACESKFAQDRKIYQQMGEGAAIWLLNCMVSGIIGVVFFSGGFFTGQSLALAVFGLFFTSISATFWPILLISIVVGLAALSIYWFVERPALQNLVGSWFGRDPEKIAQLLDSSDFEELEAMQLKL